MQEQNRKLLEYKQIELDTGIVFIGQILMPVLKETPVLLFLYYDPFE